MTLNPIKALSEQLQKLITEHGSSAILREHLALFKDQLAVFEKKVLMLENKIKTLKSQLDNATKEIERQNKIIKAFQEVQGTKKYDPVTNKIIQLFFDAGRELSITEVATGLSIDINTARYHFDLLSKDELIMQTQAEFESSWANQSSPAMYDLSPLGRKYIVESKTSKTS